ncbi:hypothetical protein [Qipengyuania citrea]|uniref:hypothetical protein n=1 Tax=Qipengyuania citrea TaxID=225971 RepID=UPI0032993AFC
MADEAAQTSDAKYTVLDPITEKHIVGLAFAEAAETALTHLGGDYDIRPSELGWRLWYGRAGKPLERTIIESRKLDILDARREIFEAVLLDDLIDLDVEVMTDRAAQDLFTGCVDE